MKTNITSTIAALALGALFTTAAKATDYSSWRLNPNPIASLRVSSGHPNILENGVGIINEKRADSKGGVLRVRIQPKDAGSKAREYRFEWSFDRDVTEVRITDKPIVVTLSITGDANANSLSYNPFMDPGAIANRQDNDQLGQDRQRYYFKGTGNTAKTRLIGRVAWNKDSAYSFRMSFWGFGSNYNDELVIDYSYTGIQTTTPPVTVSPTAKTPNSFWIQASNGSYYTFTKSGNNIIENLWNTTSSWTLSYYGEGTMNNVGHGIMVTNSGYYYFIPDINATGSMSKQLFIYAGNNTWNPVGQMQGLK